jgi:hypothetical protein
MINLLIGLLVGYTIVTLCESFYHRISGHATLSLRLLCPRLGPLGNIILDRWYSHYVIHHCSTFKQNYVTQFSTQQEIDACTAKLESENNHHIIKQSFGLRVGSPIDYFSYAIPTLPFIIFACYFGNVSFACGAILPLIIMPLMSQFIHPLLHLDYQRALKTAHPFLLPFVRTRYFRYIARHHWLHHKHPKCNFNLILGGDLLFRCHRSPTSDELREMKNIGLA